MKGLEFNPAAKEILCRLCERFPRTPFLALGQTIFWDEPAKAFFVRLLEECAPRVEFWHGIHDTDYFSRLPRPLSGPRPYALVEHNDLSTRGLWVAMCEASRLFGAEVLPTRSRLRRHGCNLAKAFAAPEAGSLSLDSITSAWGWKGIASTGERELVGRDVLLADLNDELIALVREAMQGTTEAIADAETREEARRKTEELIGELQEYAAAHPAATLSQFYQHLLPRFYRLLLGELPDNLKVISSSSLFRFNPQSAGRPRFSPLALFLRPDSRPHARRAYDEAVTGSGIYTLDQFGADAIPFDLVVPGQGRGTICVSPTEILIHTPQSPTRHSRYGDGAPISLPISRPVEETTALAEVLSEHLGSDIALVGKAVVLIPMITQEFILLFHQGASAYVEHTHEFVAFLQREGISLNCHPILRLCHRAWDALGAVKVHLHLPAHLAEAFGRPRISTEEFSSRWREVVQRQRALLQNLAQMKKPTALLAFLAQYYSDMPAGREARSRSGSLGDKKASIWEERLSGYLQTRRTLAGFGRQLADCQRQVSRLRHQGYSLRQEVQQIEKEKGRHFREVLKPLLARGFSSSEEETRRRALQEEIERKKADLASLQGQLQRVRESQRAMEDDAELRKTRRAARTLEAEAEAERLRLVRNAILTAEGLEQTNRRPTGWWPALVSPEGRWFTEMARTSTLEVEPICPASESQRVMRK